MSPEEACVSESTLMAFFAGELPLDRISEIERHLDCCAACTALVQTVAPVLAGQSGGPPAIWSLPPEAQPGTLLAQRYRLEALLGWGAAGFVLRAHDELLGIRVAVKMVRAELSVRPAWLDRLARELQVARALAHRHVCRVFELVTGPTPFLVMELAERSLRDELLATSPEPNPAALDSRLADAQAVTSGLVAMHDAGILHRDIKPANVLRLADGRLVLSDFGLASIAPERSAATRFVGTPSYMAPRSSRANRPRGRPTSSRWGWCCTSCCSGGGPSGSRAGAAGPWSCPISAGAGGAGRRPGCARAVCPHYPRSARAAPAWCCPGWPRSGPDGGCSSPGACTGGTWSWAASWPAPPRGTSTGGCGSAPRAG